MEGGYEKFAFFDQMAYLALFPQEAQLSQRDRARFVSLNMLSHSRSFEMTLLSKTCVSPYYYFIENVCMSYRF